MMSPAHSPRRAANLAPREVQSQLPRGRRPSFERARAELAARLHERRAEIEEAVLTRAIAVSPSPEPTEPDYAEGLRRAVSAAVGYSLEVVEVGEERSAAPPPALLAQARLAARYGVDLATVLRRYSAGYVLISDFLVEEVERAGFGGAELQRLLRSQGTLDRLLAAVSEEHARESRERPSSTEERKAERIERLLGGEALDASQLNYELSCTHLAAIATGEGTREALRELARAFECRLLTLPREDGTLWAWLGSREPLEMCALHRYAKESWPEEAKVAIGESGEGLPGWRFSHRQAKAALPVALRGPEPFVRYADVALLAAVLKDELLSATLRKLYLEPLEVERDGGEVLRETLRAYFAAGRNVSAAAAVLGVTRKTVNSRLRAIEALFNRMIANCGTELEMALRLEGYLGLRTHPRPSGQTVTPESS
jgi:hypothetical protein